jgi:Cytochrome C biogenesis protein transmembrane region
MRAFLLGLSNGAACVAYCAPVLIPILLGGEGPARNVGVTLRFLGGRLAGYLLFSVLVWAVAKPVLRSAELHDLIIGPAFMILSILLIVYGLLRRDTTCAVSRATTLIRKIPGISPSLIAVAAGLATGLSFCPPFLLATAGAAETGGLLQTVGFFLLFFLGTSIFFIPAPLFGFLRGFAALALVGKMAAGIMGLYYFYAGLIMTIGGLHRL